MIIPCGDIAHGITNDLREKVSALAVEGKRIKLMAVLIGDEPSQHSYIRIKRGLAGSLNIDFELLHYVEAPPFDEFLTTIQRVSTRQDVSGIIIQLPLPDVYHRDKLYESIPTYKDIEGHTSTSHFVFPLVQACMIGLDRVHQNYAKTNIQHTVPFTPSVGLIEWLQDMRITIAGRGTTTGKPIAAYFDMLGIPYAQTSSATADPDSFYRRSDIIICGVGKKIITKENIKKGVVLLNFGLHRGKEGVSEKQKKYLVGDYDENEILDIASWYTITPGGLGPIDVLCLYGNLIESVAHKHKT